MSPGPCDRPGIEAGPCPWRPERGLQQTRGGRPERSSLRGVESASRKQVRHLDGSGGASAEACVCRRPSGGRVAAMLRHPSPPPSPGSGSGSASLWGRRTLCLSLIRGPWDVELLCRGPRIPQPALLQGLLWGFVCFFSPQEVPVRLLSRELATGRCVWRLFP